MSLEKNKALARRWMDELWTRGNYDVAPELIAANFVRNDPFNRIVGPEAYCRDFIEPYRKAFPDMAFTIEEVIAERDLVLIRWVSQSTHTGELKGIPPTGKKVSLDGMDLLRIVDGKIVEGWPGFDGLALMKHLGVM